VTDEEELQLDQLDPETLARELMMSPTLQRIAGMASDCPFDVKNRELLRAALVTSVYAVIKALDGGDIAFAKAHDRAMLHVLMMSVMEVVMDGQFGASVVKGSLQ
jgi:hypothetical protein